MKQSKVVDYQEITLTPLDRHYLTTLDSVPDEVEHHSRASGHWKHARFIESHAQSVVVPTSHGAQERAPCHDPPDFIDQGTLLAAR